MLEIRNVTAGYDADDVLHGVTAACEPSRITVIVGPNGCGKSTLLKAVTGLLPLRAGEITVDGTPLQTAKPRERARCIAYLAQGKTVPDMTVEQLVLHGRFARLDYPRRYRREDREIAAEAMRRLGLETVASRALSTLSGGLRQTAYIAMALAQDTPYLLLDEPTTFLDIGHQLALTALLRALAEDGKGILAVLHDLPLAMACADRVIVMKDGRVAAQGTPDELFESAPFADVFGVTLGRQQTDRGWSYYYE